MYNFVYNKFCVKGKLSDSERKWIHAKAIGVLSVPRAKSTTAAYTAKKKKKNNKKIKLHRKNKNQHKDTRSIEMFYWMICIDQYKLQQIDHMAVWCASGYF